MLLRSSSTPVLGSLVSSIVADSPNNNNHHHETSDDFRHHPSSSFHGNRLSFHPSPGSVHLSTVASCGSSPTSPSVVDQGSDFELKGFRRAQSDGNLEGLDYSACNGSDEFYNQNQHKKLSARNKCLMLQTIPSFSFYNSGSRCEEEDGSDSEGEEVTVSDEKGLVGVDMFLPIGLEAAVDGGGRSGGDWGGGGGEFNSAGSNGDGEIEEHYRRMSKRDLQGAEEYYGRAVLVDPKDGKTLSQYAKLVWELHHNEERASNYFERAVQASPQDCHVQAAYASFPLGNRGREMNVRCLAISVAFPEPSQPLKRPTNEHFQ
ncbi:Tetratricopeptide repeat-like superfamily protein, putative isoform 2 [Hibiscus syriacus]|uniref:Tetratricopeptide repeat-like superfamily protein, putative isoform 2 n=1 Tax=Hibiscus syriacus TaxID=106335 RepID=A0A6A3AAD6_HIBSY|nr:Tetratricopeptide repeat-like superfamily protein, putative isoform 2 [Hibiscus syriacus]